MVTVANCGAIKGSFANRARRGVNTDEISADSPVVYDAQRRQGNDSARASGESTDLPEEVKPPAALPPSPQCLPPLMLMPPLLTDESTAPPSSSAPSSSLPLPPPAPQFGVYTEAEINLLSADPAEGNDKHTQAGETTNPDVLAPFIFKIPGW